MNTITIMINKINNVANRLPIWKIYHLQIKVLKNIFTLLSIAISSISASGRLFETSSRETLPYDMFANHSWYFRNALVRANYKNAVRVLIIRLFIWSASSVTCCLVSSGTSAIAICIFIQLKSGGYSQIFLPEQVPNKHPTSTPQVQDKLHTDDSNIIKIVQVVGEQKLSVKEIMDRIGLKDRKNVLSLYLNPAITGGYIRLLYPDKPRHPRQKYLLTVKGLAFYNEKV